MVNSDDQTLFAQLFSFKSKKTAPSVENNSSNHNTIFLILAAVVLVTYFNSLFGQAVSDDKGLFDEGNLARISFIFSDPLNFGRYLIYGLIYLFFGFNTFLFHLLNVLFHFGNAALIYLIVNRLATHKTALLASLIFSVHPILTEAVAWISGGTYSQYTFFFLLSFLFYLKGVRGGFNKKFYLLSLGVFIYGLLSSNRVLFLSPIFLLYEFCLGDLRKNRRLTLPYLGLSTVWGGIYGWQITHRVGELQELTYSDSTVGMNPLIQIPFAITTYLELIFWPKDLTFYHSDLAVTTTRVIWKWLGLLVFLGFWVWGFFKNRFVFFWLSLFVISLAITLTPLKIASLVAERYVYFGTIGIIVPLSMVLARWMENKKNRLLIGTIFYLIISILVIRTMVRNSDWYSTDTLMLATVRTTPESPRAQNNVGAYYYRQGDYQRAAEAFQKAVAANPRFADAYHNLGELQYMAGDYDKSIALNLESLKYAPNLWQAYKSLGEAYLKKGDKENALKALSFGLRINPGSQVMLKLQEEASK